jgi:hypothetical protein
VRHKITSGDATAKAKTFGDMKVGDIAVTRASAGVYAGRHVMKCISRVQDLGDGGTYWGEHQTVEVDILPKGATITIHVGEGT